MAALWYISLLCVSTLVSTSLSASLPESTQPPPTAPASSSTSEDSDSDSEPAKGEINFDQSLVGVLDRPPFDPLLGDSLVDSLVDPLVDLPPGAGDVFVEIDPRLVGHHGPDHHLDEHYVEEIHDGGFGRAPGGYAGVYVGPHAGHHNGIFSGGHGLFGGRANIGAVPAIINMMMGFGGKMVGDMGWLVHDVMQGVVGGILNASEGLIGGVRHLGPLHKGLGLGGHLGFGGHQRGFGGGHRGSRGFGGHVGYGGHSGFGGSSYWNKGFRPLLNPYDNTDDGVSLAAFVQRDRDD